MTEDQKIKKSYHIKNFYLDPNNYRFIDQKEYKKVEEQNITDEQVQKKARTFIEGDKRKNVQDLMHSFKANGYVPVEKIQVKSIGDNQYVVLEGNRRLTALKILFEEYEQNRDIGSLNPTIFKKLEVEEHDKELEQTHMLVMGLKHIGSNKKWASINQAKFIRDYIEKFDGDTYEAEDSACETLGISKQKLRRFVKALALIEQYQKSDFGDQFTNDKFSLFEEVVKSPDIRVWLEWDDFDYGAKNTVNRERLFDWLSFVEVEDEEYDEEKTLEPIITKSVEIRQLKIFINEENALSIMEEYRDFSKGLINSKNKEQINIQESIGDLKNNIYSLLPYKEQFELELKKEIEEIYEEFIKIVPSKGAIWDNKKINNSIYFKTVDSHFSFIDIEKYKIFENFKVEKLNKINIFAGYNNSGKTSLLEAIYILSKQNDLNSFFNILKLKNKFKELDPTWLYNYMKNRDVKISGEFNGQKTTVEILSKLDGHTQKSDYLTSVEVSSSIAKDRYTKKTSIYEYSSMISIMVDEEINLCRSMFKSPFFYNEDDLLLSHKSSVERKLFEKVKEFIKKIDKNINDIDLTDAYGIKRFLVDSELIKDTRVDLTSYGEGLQRVFEIALAFGYAKDGIVLIDELETAIHHSLLVEFTRFIQELSDEFNVQVFITSHSKECIDAFVKNKYKNDNISAYILQNNDNSICYKYSDGDRLSRLVDSMDIDIRGDK